MLLICIAHSLYRFYVNFDLFDYSVRHVQSFEKTCYVVGGGVSPCLFLYCRS